MKNLNFFIIAVMVLGCASSGKLKNFSEDALHDFKWLPQAQQDKYRKEIVRRHPEWSAAVKTNVLAGKVEEGMTKDQVLASIGKPAEILGRNSSENDELVIWIYKGCYIEFDRGKVNAVYDRKNSLKLNK